MIENIAVEGLDNIDYKKILEEIKPLGSEYSKHRFELSRLGTNSLFYSIFDYLLNPLKRINSLRKIVNYFLLRLRRYLSNHKKILVSYFFNHVWTADSILDNLELAPVRRVEYPWAITKASLTQSMRVLDIGSGRSLFPIYLASKGHDVVCIDNDQILMDRVSPKLAEWSGTKVDYVTNDVTKLDFNENEFDRVFCISVLEHLEEEMVDGKRVNYHRRNLDVKAIEEMLRAVKPNGLVIITVEWSEDPQDIQAYRVRDIYERLLKPYLSFLVSDKKPEIDWEKLKKKHYDANKRFRPNYMPSDSWAIGIVLQKPNT